MASSSKRRYISTRERERLFEEIHVIKKTQDKLRFEMLCKKGEWS